jgi:DNA-binding MarR family transcriptional regulator
VDLEQLRATFREYLYLPDPALVDFVMAVVVASRLPGDPVWGIPIGGSSSGKTEVIESTQDLAFVHKVSSMTASTLVSGAKVVNGRDPSLLIRMDQEEKDFLAVKDFTTILDLRAENRAEILAQLREVFDGSIAKEYGTGKSVRWSGRLGFIAGVTPLIDIHHAVINVLGERFIYFRLPEVDPVAVARKAVQVIDDDEQRATLRAAVVEFVGGLDTKARVEPDEETLERLTRIAAVTTWSRSGVQRDPYGSRDILIAPTPEGPARFVKQLRRLWEALTVMGHEDPLAFAERIARDSMSRERLRALLRLYVGPATTTTLRKEMRLSNSAGKRVLEDLEALGLVHIAVPGGEGVAHVWDLTEEGRDAWSWMPDSTANLTRKTRGEGIEKKEIHIGGESGRGSTSVDALFAGADWSVTDAWMEDRQGA